MAVTAQGPPGLLGRVRHRTPGCRAGLRGGWRAWEGCLAPKKGTSWPGRAVTCWETSLRPKVGVGDSEDAALLCCVPACRAKKGGKVGWSPSVPEDAGDHRVQAGGGQGLATPTVLKTLGQRGGRRTRRGWQQDRGVAAGQCCPRGKALTTKKHSESQDRIPRSQTHTVGCPERTRSHGPPKEAHGEGERHSEKLPGMATGMCTGEKARARSSAPLACGELYRAQPCPGIGNDLGADQERAALAARRLQSCGEPAAV